MSALLTSLCTACVPSAGRDEKKGVGSLLRILGSKQVFITPESSRSNLQPYFKSFDWFCRRVSGSPG